MAIKISGSTIIDDSRGIVNAGISTFANDVKYTSATTGLGVFYDRSADTLKLLEDGSDNTKLTLGDNSSYSSYMQIYHDGGNSGVGYINYAGSNKMVLSGNNIALMNTARSENMLTAVQDGAVSLYHNNSIKFQTTSTGAKVTGDLTLEEADAGTATALPEFKLFKNSSSVTAADYLGQIKFAGNSSSGTERNYAKITAKVLDSTNGSEDGALEFAHIKAGSQTITGRWRSDSLQLLNGTALTVAGTTTVTGNILPSQDSNTDIGSNGVRFANIYADTLYGDASNLTGITASNITVADESSDTQNFLVFTNSATGNQAPKTGSNLTFNASSGILYATQFSGDGSSLTNVNATTFTVTSNNSANETVYLLFADGNSGSQGAETDTNLTYNPSNDTLTAVTFSGAHSGNGAALTNVDAATLDGIDSTSFLRSDAADVKTSGNLRFNDSVAATFGTSDDLDIQHNGVHSYISNYTGSLILDQHVNDGSISLRSDNGSGGITEYIECVGSSGEVRLRHYGSQKFVTASTGIDVTGTITADGLDMEDNQKILLGTGDDLEIYHDGSNNVIKTASNQNLQLYSTGAGAVQIQSDSPKLIFDDVTGGAQIDISMTLDAGVFTMADDTNSDTFFKYTQNGAVEIYHNNSKKLETTSGGITVTGNVDATSYTGDGSQLTGIVAGITPTENTVDQAQPISFFVGTAQTSLAGISTQNFVFNPSSTRLGIGTDSPSDTLEVKSEKGQGPTFVNSVTSNGGTSLTLNGIQSGDLVLFMGVSDNWSVPTPQTDSSNWTDITGISNNNTSSPYRAVFYKFATGSSITATFTSSNVGYAMLAYRFVDSSTPFDVNATSTSSSGSMPNCPAITPVSDKSLIIAAGFLDDDEVASTTSAPTGYTLAVASNNSLNSSTLMVAHKLLPLAATENPGAFTDSSGNTDSFIADTIALRFNPGAITNDFRFGSSGIEVTTDDFVIDSSRSVGIKTDSPDADLHVDGTLLVSPPTNLDDSIPHFQINNTGIITSLFSVSNNQVLIDIDTTVSGILTANNFDFNNSTDGLINAGIITASEYNGDGSKLTKIPLEFYAGISSSNHFEPTSFETTVFTFPSTAGKQYVIESINVANTETSVGVGTTVNIIASIEDASAAEQTYIAYNVPIANGGTIELLKNPIVAGPSDVMKMWVTDQSYIGITTAAEVYMNFTEFTSSEYISKFAGPTTINTIAPTTLYTSTGNPTMLQRIGFVNRTDSGDYPVSIRVTSGLSTTYLVKDLIIPRYSTVDILDRYKRIETDAKLEVEVGSTSTIDVIVSGRKIL